MREKRSWDDHDREAAGEEALAREAHWLRSLGWCRCSRPVLDRRYLGRWSCRCCGLLLRRWSPAKHPR